MDSPTYRRVVSELCAEVGFKNPEILLTHNGQLRIDDCFVSFLYDEAFLRNQLFVYIDLGPVTGDKERAYEHLLKLNTELTAGARGVMSLHPETERVLYSFQYPLSAEASGRDLLGTIVCFVNGTVDGTHPRPERTPAWAQRQPRP